MTWPLLIKNSDPPQAVDDLSWEGGSISRSSPARPAPHAARNLPDPCATKVSNIFFNGTGKVGAEVKNSAREKYRHGASSFT